MPDVLLRILGWRFLLVTGDPCVLDRWRWLRSRLRAGPVRTFDAGCGNGAFSIYAARIGNSVVAASFSPEEQQSARERAELLGIGGIDFRLIDLREIAAHRDALGLFDQIICLETIEHVTADQDLVSVLASMLAPGGQILISTPYAGHRALYTEEPEPSPVEDGSHVRYGYTQVRLAEIAAVAGLQVTEQGMISGLISQKLTDLMRRLSERIGLTAAWLVVLPLRPLALIDGPVSRVTGYPYLSVGLRAFRSSEPAPTQQHGPAEQPASAPASGSLDLA